MFVLESEEENISSSNTSRRVTDSGGSSKSCSSGPPPVEKKSRLLGKVDLNSPEVQKLLNAKSSHAALVDDVSDCSVVATFGATVKDSYSSYILDNFCNNCV